jgi:ligand-binding SRPBCC domain-containing protein
MAKSKIVKIETTFSTPVDRVWSLLTKFDTLSFITRPMASFKPLGKVSDWRKGSDYSFRLRIFGIPMGVHEIRIVKMGRSEYTIVSHEHNRFVKTWNHTIKLEPLDDSTTGYTDIIEINAGKMTNLVVAFARIFYKHRQKRWKKLLDS